MKTKKVIFSLIIAALLWFFMFSNWTKELVNFWIMMPISGCILTFLALLFGNKDIKEDIVFNKNMLIYGIVIAILLWFVFFIGDKIASFLFNFARSQVDNIYNLRTGTQKYIIGGLLLLIIGPSEEIFWRGFIQKQLSKTCGKWQGFVFTLLIYTLIHLWSFNFMLAMAAMTAGFIWGLLYYFKPKWLLALIISHAIWDCIVFVIFPI